MDQKLTRNTKTLKATGMTCPNCEMRIENTLKNVAGIVDVETSYASEVVHVTFEPSQVELLTIIEAIESLGYHVESTINQSAIHHHPDDADAPNKRSEITNLLGIGVIFLAIYLVIKNTIGFHFIPEINQNMGYGLLFIVGLLTSVHCIAMCGGINLSQCVSSKAEQDGGIATLRPSFLYNAGRVTSYTLIGGIVGAIGSVLRLSGIAQGFVAILAGVFMVVMGMNMLNLFPALRKIMPSMPKKFGHAIHNNNGSYGPYVVGLLNGFMPCGPLQSMQLYALGTGSFAAGALSMFLFSLGTVPLMFGFGAISSLLSSKFTRKLIKVSAALVIVLGFMMFNRGLGLSGINPINLVPTVAATNENRTVGGDGGTLATISGDVQYVTTTLRSGRYEPITVQAGVPVKWTIQADPDEINGCNNAMNIPAYGISNFKLNPGDNLIEFTPDKTGKIPYTCWMGMIRSSITVVDEWGDPDQAAGGTDDEELFDHFEGGFGGGGCCTVG